MNRKIHNGVFNFETRMYSSTSSSNAWEYGCMNPSTLEDILILKMNKDLWDVYLVQEIYEELCDKRAQKNAQKKAVLNLHVPVVDMLGADEADVGDEDEEARRGGCLLSY